MTMRTLAWLPVRLFFLLLSSLALSKPLPITTPACWPIRWGAGLLAICGFVRCPGRRNSRGLPHLPGRYRRLRAPPAAGGEHWGISLVAGPGVRYRSAADGRAGRLAGHRLGHRGYRVADAAIGSGDWCQDGVCPVKQSNAPPEPFLFLRR